MSCFPGFAAAFLAQILATNAVTFAMQVTWQGWLAPLSMSAQRSREAPSLPTIRYDWRGLDEKVAWDLRYYVQVRSLMLDKGEFRLEQGVVKLLQ